MLRGRQTESLPLQAAILWERLVFHSFPLLSHEFLWILRCSLLSCSTLLRYSLFPFPPLLFPALFSVDSHGEFSFVLPPLSVVVNPRLHLFQLWAKQKKSNQAPTPGRCQNLEVFVFWVVPLSLLDSIASCCHYFRGAFVLRHILLLFPVVIAPKSCPVPFVPPRGLFGIAARFYCIRFLTSFVSTLIETIENQFCVHAAGHCQYCLANIFCFFQARWSEFA